jgi:hypothetical protein
LALEKEQGLAEVEAPKVLLEEEEWGLEFYSASVVEERLVQKEPAVFHLLH